jgi:hypothetical protein
MPAKPRPADAGRPASEGPESADHRSVLSGTGIIGRPVRHLEPHLRDVVPLVSLLQGWGRRGSRGPRPLIWPPIMPHKVNAACRHHIPRQKRRVTNWAEYDASLR